jgi:hypothetical protein
MVEKGLLGRYFHDSLNLSIYDRNSLQTGKGIKRIPWANAQGILDSLRIQD